MSIKVSPYEISIWDYPNNDEEKKVAIIGSHLDTYSPFRALNPTLTQNINGTETLTFQMFWRYYDETRNEFIPNPLEKYLVNERKVKLFYKGEWKEFIIKSIEESKEEYKKDFVCNSAAVVELSRNGYNVELDNVLYNNQGTVIELAKTILEDSAWVVDEANSDKIYSFYSEPLYRATVISSFTGIDIRNPQNTKTFGNGDFVYLFYSEVNSKAIPFQVIYYDPENPPQYDSNNVLINTPVYLVEQKIDESILEIGDIDLVYEGTRFVLSQLGHYDEVLGAYVKDYRDGNNELKYGYTEYEYLTSDMVGNLITNSTDFLLGSAPTDEVGVWGMEVENWRGGPGGAVSQGTYPKYINEINDQVTIDLETNPSTILTSLMFASVSHRNAYVYNFGINENLQHLPNGITEGDKFICRIKGFRTGLLETNHIPYPATAPPFSNLESGDIKIDFNGNGRTLIKGELTADSYCDYERIEGTIGVTNPQEEKWYEASNGNFVLTNDTSYNNSKSYYKKVGGSWYSNEEWPVNWTGAHYYYISCEAKETLSKDDLNNLVLELCISSRYINSSNYYAFEDIEFFPYFEDKKFTAKGYPFNALLPGSALISEIRTTLRIFDPEENVGLSSKDQYKWEANYVNDEADTQTDYTKVYNDYLAIDQISGAQSNYYNLIQELNEKFHCWAKFDIKHDENGYTIFDDYYYLSPDIRASSSKTYYTKNGSTYEPVTEYDFDDPKAYYNPKALGWYEVKNTDRVVIFKEYVGKENYAGFRYRINLSSISRTLDSEAFVSKMFVLNNETEGAQNGVCTIERAAENPSGLSTLYDFSYYVHQGLVDEESLKFNLYDEEEGFYPLVKKLTDQNRELTDQINLVTDKFIEVGSRKITLEAEQVAAKEEKADALQDMCDFVNFKGNEEFITTPADPDCYDKLSRFMAQWTSDVNDRGSDDTAALEYWIKYTNAASNWATINEDYKDVKAQYDAIEARLNELQKERNKIVGEINKITRQFQTTYNQFIQEGTWNDEDAIEDDKYYYSAANTLRVSSQPQVSYTINVLDLSELEGYELYEFGIADKTYIEDTEFFGWTTSGTPYREEVVVSEIQSSLSDPSLNTITVQNYRTQFEDLFQRISAAVQSIETNANSYNRAAQIIQPSGRIDQDSLDKSLNDNSSLSVSFGTGAIRQDGEGITIRGLGNNQKNRIRITGNGLYVSEDGGVTWLPVINDGGINAAALNRGAIDVTGVTISNGNSPSFQWDSSGLTSYSFDSIYFEGIAGSEFPAGTQAWDEGELSEIVLYTEEEEESE